MNSGFLAPRPTSHGRRNGAAGPVRALVKRFALASLVSTLAALALPVLGIGVSEAGAVVATVPATPTTISAIAGQNSDEVSWTVGANGGDPITSFVVTAYEGATEVSSGSITAGAVGSTFDPTPGAVDTYVLNGAAITSANFTIASSNSVGTGAASAHSNDVTATTAAAAPYPPTMVTASSPSSGTIVVDWTVPANNGSAITLFTVTPSLNGTAQTPIPLTAGAVGSTVDPTPTASDSVTLSSQAAGSYTFTVSATNAVATGSPSAPSNTVVLVTPPPAVLTASPTSLNFGDITVGDFGQSQNVTLTNTGGSPDTITQLNLNGVGSDDYGENDDCTTVAPGDSCTVSVFFNPGALGARPATMTVDDTAHSTVSVAFTGQGSEGYYQFGSAGEVGNFGDAAYYGDPSGLPLNRPIVAFTPTGDDGGYWFTASDGGVFAYGDAQFYGSTGNIHLNKPIVGMVATPDDGGYWMVASDGGIFSFGDAKFYGSTGNIHLNKPIVGMAVTPDGGGYWLVASDGGIFSFGDAPFYGSTGALHLNQPIVGMAETPDGGGYWMVAADGGIFAFGDAPYLGSTGAIHLNKPIVGMSVTPDGGGYWFTASDGGVFAFGDAPYYGSVEPDGVSDVIGIAGDGPPTIQAFFDDPAARSAKARHFVIGGKKAYAGPASASGHSSPHWAGSTAPG